MRHISSKILTSLIVALLFGSSLAIADDWAPWEASDSGPFQTTRLTVGPLDQAVRNFQTYISPIDGPRCPMYPTCSGYARQALHKHGPLLGVFMTADRLMHEGDPIEQQETIMKWGHRRFFDPLRYNDYWLNVDKKTER